MLPPLPLLRYRGFFLFCSYFVLILFLFCSYFYNINILKTSVRKKPRLRPPRVAILGMGAYLHTFLRFACVIFEALDNHPAAFLRRTTSMKWIYNTSFR